MRWQLHSIFLLTLLSALPATATDPYLVADIDPHLRSGDSAPIRFITLGEIGLFLANDGETGHELWRSDGTPEGTYLVANHCDGYCGIEIRAATVAGDRAFYQIRDGEGAAALWITGGTPATTFRLTGPEVTSLEFLPVWIGRLGLYFFVAYDAEHGAELWRSDGTPVGTYRVTDLSPGPAGPPLHQLTEFKGRLFFSADDGDGPALWSSDGTPADTRLVFDPRPGSASHTGPERLTVAGNHLIFVAPAAGRGLELWRSDGTTRGTSLLRDLKPGSGSPQILDLRRLGNRVYFVADTGRGQELWVSDGTAAGTRELTRFSEKWAFFGETYGLSLPRVTLPNGRMVFAVNDGPHGIEPWITDGTPAGTRLLREICPGACSMTEFAEMGYWLAQGRIWFFGDDGERGDELWSTDGTRAGTRLLRDICPGPCHSFAYPFATLKGRLLFAASDGTHGFELWQAGPGARGASRLSDTVHFAPYDLEGAALPGAFLFAASDAEHGIELWKTDGTRAGTGLVRDIAGVDHGGSRPWNLRTAGGKLYFYADDGVHGVELWTSDGTSAGTRLVNDLAPGSPSFVNNVDPIHSADLNGVLLFVHSNEDYQLRLWRTDGSAAGTFPLVPEDLKIHWEGLHVIGGEAYFVAENGEDGPELWKTDGTTAGTLRIDLFHAGSSGSAPTELTAFDGNLFFVARTEGARRDLWRSDGTPEGTKPVHEDLGSASQILGAHAGRLYFTAATPEEGLEPWSTDGTPAGARPLIDLVPGPDSLALDRAVSVGDRMFLTRSGFGDPPGLWSSDGTAEGTRELGSPAVSPSPLAVLDGFLYYTETNGGYPGTLWRSDGTEDGTAPFLDASGQQIVPGDLVLCGPRLYFQRNGEIWRTDGTPEGTGKVPGAAGVGEMRRAGSRLFFQGHDPAIGYELWALDGC